RPPGRRCPACAAAGRPNRPPRARSGRRRGRRRGCRPVTRATQGRLRALIALLALAGAAQASALPHEAAVPGGIAIVRLGNGAERAQAWFGEKRVAVGRDGQGWVALVGLPLALEPGTHALRAVSDGNRRDEVEFHPSWHECLGWLKRHGCDTGPW